MSLEYESEKEVYHEVPNTNKVELNEMCEEQTTDKLSENNQNNFLNMYDPIPNGKMPLMS